MEYVRPKDYEGVQAIDIIMNNIVEMARKGVYGDNEAAYRAFVVVAKAVDRSYQLTITPEKFAEHCLNTIT